MYSPTGLLPIILQQITLLTYERPKLYPSILAIPQPISNRLWGNEILNMADADQLTYILSGDSFESLSFNPLDWPLTSYAFIYSFGSIEKVQVKTGVKKSFNPWLQFQFLISIFNVSFQFHFNFNFQFQILIFNFNFKFQISILNLNFKL